MNSVLSIGKLPSEKEIALAKKSSRVLSSYLADDAETQQVALLSEQGEQQTVLIPESTFRLLVSILIFYLKI